MDSYSIRGNFQFPSHSFCEHFLTSKPICRKKAFEAALLAEHWRIKFDDITWPKSGKAFGSRKSMVSILQTIPTNFAESLGLINVYVFCIDECCK